MFAQEMMIYHQETMPFSTIARVVAYSRVSIIDVGTFGSLPLPEATVLLVSSPLYDVCTSSSKQEQGRVQSDGGGAEL